MSSILDPRKVFMIHVIATIELKEGQREAFLEEFHRLVPQVHAEAGCIAYGPAVDLPTDIPAQSPVRSDVVTVVEQWESLDHLKAHLAAPHMNDYRGRVAGMLKNVTLSILAPA